MFDFMRFRRVALGLVLLTAAGASQAAAEVSVAATDATVTIVNGTVNAQFRIAATNGDAADATNLVVVLQDGTQVVVGDVLAGGTASSGVQAISYDASQTPTKAQTLRVAVRYNLGGQAVEQAAAINLPVQD